MLHKLWTAMRGAQNEVLEKAVDAQAVRILDQELRDAASHLRRSTVELTGLMAREIAAERGARECQQRGEHQEALVRRALAANEEKLAEEGAALLSQTLTTLEHHRANQARCRDQIARLRQAVTDTERRLAEMRRELAQAKSIAALQAAEGSLVRGTRSCASALQAAEETLERIKQLQGTCADEIEAAKRLADEKTGANFERAMEQAGLVPAPTNSPQALLDRLRRQAADEAGRAGKI